MTDAGWNFPPPCLEGRQPAPNCSTRRGFQDSGIRAGRRHLPGVAITYKRIVEAARKARSKRPARAGRMEVMTIIQPLRRPGHVSMELGFSPARIGTIQRLHIHRKADCPSQLKLNILQGLAAPQPHNLSCPSPLAWISQGLAAPWPHNLSCPFPLAWISHCSNVFDMDSPSRPFPPVPYHGGPHTPGRSQDSPCHHLAP